MPPKTLIAAFLTAAALSFGAAAHADVLPSGVETISVKLRLGDLDLAADPGARSALARVRYAAELACGEAGDNRDLTHWTHRRACVDATVGRAVAALASPRVSALYAGGQGPSMTLAAYRGR